MKKLSLVLLVSLLSFACKDDAASKVNQDNVNMAAERDMAALDLPKITFDKEEHDFGNITNGTAVETTFTYTNTGNSPLVVSDIKSTCGCTVPSDWNKDPLAPGESSSFTVKFNGRGQNSVQKTVTLTTNTENGAEKVKIKAFVEKDENATK